MTSPDRAGTDQAGTDQARTEPEHTEHTGGVRGAINDLLGRGDRRDERDADRRGDPDTTPGPNADQPYGDRAYGDQAYGDQAYSDQAYRDQSFGDGAPAGAAAQQVDEPGAARTDRFDDEPGVHGDATGDGRRDTATAGLFGREDDVRRDHADEPVAAPHEGATTGVAGSPQVNPDVPAQARLDTPPPGQAAPRHELLGQDDGLPAGREQVRDERDRPVDGGAGVHDTGLAGSTAAPAHTDQQAGATGTPVDGSATTGLPATDLPATASGAPASVGTDDEGRERLVPAERATDYGTRWDQIKGEFVDEPRQAVAGADTLVGELLDELQKLFAEQRQGLDRGFDADEASTEDLRLALRRYRSFFDRLLSI